MEKSGKNLRYYADDPAYNAPFRKWVPGPDDFIRKYVTRWIPRGEGDCIEIGCSPGGYLTVFGDLGYRLHGIDFDPRIRTELPPWLQQQGFRPGEFIVADFTTYPFPAPYDVVYSLGFIEHFTNWVEIVARHAELVRPGGYLVIGAPNYSGIVQRILHMLFEESSYRTHVTASMCPDVWRLIIEGAGYEICHAGTVAAFDFWTRDIEPLPRITKELEHMMLELKPALAQLEDTKSFASAGYLGVVARRKETRPPKELLDRPEVKAGINDACISVAETDRHTEQVASIVVRRLRKYLDRRSRMITVMKDWLRPFVGKN